MFLGSFVNTLESVAGVRCDLKKRRGGENETSAAPFESCLCKLEGMATGLCVLCVRHSYFICF